MSNVVPLPGSDEPEWLQRCIRTGKARKPLSNVENACVALEYASEFKGMLAFNEMVKDTVIRIDDHVSITSDTHFLTDDDITEVQCRLQRLGLHTVSFDTTYRAIDHISRLYPFHPLLDVLDALEWDGTKRLDSWLVDCLGTEKTDYHAKIGRMFLISMVARIYKPGCKADYMLVLEGPQGTLKSTVCEVLAGKEYFSDHLPDLATAGKDVSIHLRGKWLIEVAEMHAFSKADTTLLKSFLSRTTERFRAPWGKVDKDEPRQCVFIGTNNRHTYLKDETGSRRFWPVKCGTIDIDKLRADRDQLLAEAIDAFHKDEKYWPDTSTETDHIKPVQDARYEEDAWAKPVSDYIAVLGQTTIRDIAHNALFIEDRFLGTVDQRRIANVLYRLGWSMKHTKTGNVWYLDTKGEPGEPR